MMGIIATFGLLRKNENDYPYVTVLDHEGNANNLYFSKSAGERILTSYNEGDKIVHELINCEVAQTENLADGETRFKLFFPGDTGYATTNEINELFGVEEVTNFDMATFKSTFSNAEAYRAQKQLENATPEIEAKENGPKGEKVSLKNS